ncbi:MAG: hypothetical protein HC915_05090 [Anaerolineae bacterium]|nr:hypothetical protein [Anaerolineae bacterium]
MSFAGIAPLPVAQAQTCVQGSGSQATNVNGVVNVGGVFLEGEQTITVSGNNGGGSNLQIRILNSSNTMIVQTNPANPSGSETLTYTVPVPDTYTLRFVSGAAATIDYSFSTLECNPSTSQDQGGIPVQAVVAATAIAKR